MSIDQIMAVLGVAIVVAASAAMGWMNSAIDRCRERREAKNLLNEALAWKRFHAESCDNWRVLAFKTQEARPAEFEERLFTQIVAEHARRDLATAPDHAWAARVATEAAAAWRSRERKAS